jgi:hypothetical protein
MTSKLPANGPPRSTSRSSNDICPRHEPMSLSCRGEAVNCPRSNFLRRRYGPPSSSIFSTMVRSSATDFRAAAFAVLVALVAFC